MPRSATGFWVRTAHGRAASNHAARIRAHARRIVWPAERQSSCSLPATNGRTMSAPNRIPKAAGNCAGIPIRFPRSAERPARVQRFTSGRGKLSAIANGCGGLATRRSPGSRGIPTNADTGRRRRWLAIFPDPAWQGPAFAARRARPAWSRRSSGLEIRHEYRASVRPRATSGICDASAAGLLRLRLCSAA
jgi:hypothetical protein